MIIRIFGIRRFYDVVDQARQQDLRRSVGFTLFFARGIRVSDQDIKREPCLKRDVSIVTAFNCAS